MRNALLTRAVLVVVATAGLAGPGAAGAVADDCSNAQFRTGPAANLPDCRAWEQVSPVEKNGVDVVNSSTVASVNRGNGVYFNAAGAFAGAESVLYDTAYVGSRADTWLTRGADPALTPTGLLVKATLGLSEDGTKAIVTTTKALAPGAIEGGSNVYVRDLTQPSSYRLVAATATPNLYFDLTGFGGQGNYIAGNSDLSAIAFMSAQPLVDEVPDGVRSLYLWHDGDLSLASHLPDGRYADLSYDGNTPSRITLRLSEDGTRVWFRGNDSNPETFELTQAMYQYVEGQGTTLISRSHRPGDDPARARSISVGRGSRDGRTLTFEASYPLTTDTAGGAIYRWSADDDDLVDLTTSHIPPGVTQVNFNLVQASPDGRFVWFTSQVGLTPDAGSGFGPRFYVIDTVSEQLHFVARFQDDGSMGLGDTRFSPNGHHVAFLSFASLTGNDNVDPVCSEPGFNGADGRCGNIFSWSADAPAEPVTCLSCGPAGTERQGPAARFGRSDTFFDGRDSRAVLDDGRVFFDSAERLVTADSNSVTDVYEYHPEHGLRLLSSGTSGEPANFGDISEDGRDVFFVTAARMVPQDVDALADLYTARVDGGVAAQQVAPAEGASGGCSGEACRPSLVPQPDRPLSGTSQFAAPEKGVSPSFSVRAPSASALRSAGRSGRLSLSVKVTAAGTVRASLAGKFAGKTTRTAARAARKATKAGTYRLSLRLSKAARSELRRKGKLRLGLAVSYSKSITEHRRSVTLTASRATTSKKGGSR